jgi:ferredoxin-NADP reductase
MIQSQTYTLSLLRKTKVAKDTFTFHFSRPQNFDFIAGQYNRWTLSMTAIDGRGTSRFFTISSPPSDKSELVVTTKAIQSDFKNALVKLKVGDKIKIFGPMGQFVLDEDSEEENVFIAGGIGITPFHSMLKDTAANNITKSLTLFVSFSIPEEVIFLNELREITKNHTNIKIIYTITKPQESQISWNGEIGRISDVMIKKYVKNIPNSIFYIVGPPPMVEGTQKVLADMNIPNDHVKTEQFSGY